jgi:hypothetical protein
LAHFLVKEEDYGLLLSPSHHLSSASWPTLVSYVVAWSSHRVGRYVHIF